MATRQYRPPSPGSQHPRHRPTHRGEWSQSWTYHPLAALILIQLAAAAVVAIQVRRGRWNLPPRLVPGWLTANAVALIGVWLIRIPLDALPPV